MRSILRLPPFKKWNAGDHRCHIRLLKYIMNVNVSFNIINLIRELAVLNKKKSREETHTIKVFF